MYSSDRRALQLEELRIRAAYARRTATIPEDRYTLFNDGNLLLAQELERRILSLLRAQGRTSLGEMTLLDVGCGRGFWLRRFIEWGIRPENANGIDLLPERIEQAKDLCPASVILKCGNAVNLEWPDCSFDLVMQATLFSSILDSTTRAGVASEMLRVLRPGGLVLWYDFHVNNPKNPDVRGVKKQEIESLFPGCRVHLERVTLLPPLARLIGPIAPAFALLSKISAIRTHYLGAIEKPQLADR